METTVKSPSTDDKKQAQTASHARENASKFSNHVFYTCAALLAIAAIALRLWGIDFGLPSLHHPDEWRVVANALSFGATHDFHPGSWNLGTLGMYVAFIVYATYGGIGLALGWFTSLTDFGLSYFVDPTPFYLIGRGIFFVCGMLSLYVVYLIGRKMAGRWAGLMAAAVLAFLPAHVERSALAFPDTMMLLLMAGALYVMIRDREPIDDYRKDLYAGLLIGLAVSAKYVAIFMVPGYIVWRFATIWTADISCGRAIKMLAVGAISGTVGLFLGMPYLFIDFEHAIPSLLGLGAGGDTLPAQTKSSALWKTMTSSENIGIVAAVLGVTGLFAAIKRRPAITLGLLAICTSNVYWALQRDRLFVRWLFAAELVLCLGVGYLIVWLSRRSIRRTSAITALAAVLAVAALAGPMANSYDNSRDRAAPDTRNIAEQWITNHIAPDSKLLIVGARASNPQPQANAESLRRWMRRAVQRNPTTYPGVVKYYEYQLKALSEIGGPSYSIWRLKHHGNVAPEYDVDVPLTTYLDKGIQYVVTTPLRYGKFLGRLQTGQVQFHRDLNSTCSELVVIGAGNGRTGPTITIWRTPNAL